MVISSFGITFFILLFIKLDIGLVCRVFSKSPKPLATQKGLFFIAIEVVKLSYNIEMHYAFVSFQKNVVDRKR